MHPATSADLKLAIVHHSVSSNTYSAGDVPALLRSIQAYHQDVQGWDDIAYNFAVDRFGRAWEARAGGITNVVVGGHAQGFNVGTVGVVVLGAVASERLQVSRPGTRVWLGGQWFGVVGILDPAPLAGRDPGYTADAGAVLNAAALRVALGGPDAGDWREWYDRHLSAFLAAMADAAPDAGPAPLRRSRAGLRALCARLLEQEAFRSTEP